MLTLIQIKPLCAQGESNRLNFKREQYLCEMLDCQYSEEEETTGLHKKGKK